METAKQLIYAAPNKKRSNVYPNLYEYIYKYDIEFGNGMLVIAARNPMRAMEIVRKRLEPMNVKVKDADLEHLVGVTVNGVEGILAEQYYSE